MNKRILVLILVVTLTLAVPFSAQAGNGNVSGSSSNGAGGSNVLNISTDAANNGESQHLNTSQQTPAIQNAGTQEGQGDTDRLMQTTRERLQDMTRDRLNTQDWKEIKQCLTQLKQQYRDQDRLQSRDEIKNLFQTALQIKKEQGDLEETEVLLRDLIAMDPSDSQPYRELGSIFQNRGENAPRLFHNGNELKPEVPPVIKEGRTLVPVRAVTEALGAAVQWNEQEQTILVSRGDTQIQLQVGNRTALVNGQEIDLDVPAEITDSRTFVPLRFIMQTMKAEIGWYPEGSIIAINQ